MTVEPDVFEALADAVAERVLSRLRDSSRPRVDGLIDAAEVADRLGVSREWVYSHAVELGAVQLGGGSRPRLRFSADRVSAISAGKIPVVQRHTGTRGRRSGPSKRSREAVPLIQIRDL